MSRRSLAKRFVEGIYSAAAENLYEPLVVQGAFRIFAGRMHETIRVRGRRAADLADDAPILDMPVGTGFFSIDVAQQHSGIVVGVDLAEGMVREARGTARKAGTPNLVLLRGDAHRLPFADDSFKVVLCWNGLQVIPGTDETVAELARVLQPDGTMFLSTLNLPVSDLMSERTAQRVPPFMAGRKRFARAIEDAGLELVSVERDRLATIFTATKAR